MRNIASKVVTFVVALIVIAGVAHAHGGKPHLLGTVVALHANHLVVKDKAGKEHTVELNGETKLEKAGKAATRAELVAGVRVAVHFADQAAKIAHVIKISPATPKSGATK
jgi:hypothetical protein